MTMFGNAQGLSPGNLGMKLFKPSAAAAPVGLWYNPLNSPAITARIAAGGLWAWRAQANNPLWGPGPANYAASLIDEAQGVNAAEIGGGPVNWAAATGWSGFNALNRCLDTTVLPVNNQQWVMFIQITNCTGLNDRTGSLTGGGPGELSIEPNRNNAAVRYANGLSLNGVPMHPNGNIAVIGANGYRDGVLDVGPFGPTVGAWLNTIWMGALNNGGGAPLWPLIGEMQAVLVCDDATAFAPADIAAIAALPAGSMHNL